MGELREALDAQRSSSCTTSRSSTSRRGRIDGAEGLVRWHHPRRGDMPPDAFIALAEETGNIRRLTRWALAAGIAQAQRWNADGRALRVAVNLSARDLDDADLPRRVGELLAAHAADPERIVLEVTESAVMGEPRRRDPRAARASPTRASTSRSTTSASASPRSPTCAACRCASSRSTRSSCTRLGRRAPRTAPSCAPSSSSAHRLGYRVTSEGVEDAAALDYLREIGCDHAQGYFIAQAVAGR